MCTRCLDHDNTERGPSTDDENPSGHHVFGSADNLRPDDQHSPA
jgi:hypothetical protein